MSKKPNYHSENLAKLTSICEKNGFEIEKIDSFQYRVYGATHIIDFWTPRMVYHRVKGEVIKSVEKYHRGLNWQLNESQVEHLLLTGEYRNASN